ncbi:ABC-F family ATP-binding cassette domain-containing protein [bacterium]|nr:ABC-F family ATP-binding cassette domain-containing protein [bacterium]MBU1984910.1 ABC-F family ATP-binding cassette domain-containing protein [bacterium]
MRLLHLHEVALVLPGKILLKPLSWSIFRRQRFGLIGPNGAGKTTLLRIMLGVTEPTDGRVERTRDLAAGYLPQEGVTHSGRTLFAEAWNGLPDLPRLESELSELHGRLDRTPDDVDLIERLGVVQHRWEDLEGYRAEAKVARVLKGLGFRDTDHGRRVEEFSGGWQMRIALAKLLLQDPDLLLLDEPTNHLDLPALLWLEGYLTRYDGALIVVSHDRRFLNSVTDGIAEIDHGELILYEGNYSAYEKARALREEQLEAEAARIADERKRIERFVERFRYKATKASQVQSRIKTLEKLGQVRLSSSARQVRFRFPPAPPSGRIVLEFIGLHHHYGSIPVFSELDLVLARGQKVALVGVNGAGKSTLCRLITGIEQPTGGSVKLGHNVEVNYFAQEADFHLDPRRTVLEEMESESHGPTQNELRKLLGAFLFSGDDVLKKVSVLSGGEKARLALAKMLLRPANLLILDEPTNHLDMTSQDVLLSALKEYDGTLIVVSHDRYFLDRLVERIMELEGGRLQDYPGSLSEYLERKGLAGDALQSGEGRLHEATEQPVPDGRYQKRERKRLEADVRNRHSEGIRQARKELEKIQRNIDRHESRKLEIEPVLADESLYRDPERCRSLMAEYDRIRKELPSLIELWEQAALRLEELEVRREKELRELRTTDG